MPVWLATSPIIIILPLQYNFTIVLKGFPALPLAFLKYFSQMLLAFKPMLVSVSQAFKVFFTPFLNQAHATASCGRTWFPEIVLRKGCVCMYVCMYVHVYLFVFPHPREQTFYLKLESSLYTNNKG